MSKRPKNLFSHRGLRPDQKKPNSFEAVTSRQGIGIECDVCLLADGNLAIVHHKDVGIAQKLVEDMTLQQLSEHVCAPLLREYLHLALDRENRLLIEIKGSSFQKAQQTASSTIKEIALVLTNPDLVSVQSFYAEALEEAKTTMHEIGIQIKLGLLWPSSQPVLSGLEFVHSKGFDAFNPHESQVTPGLVNTAHGYGIEVNAWVVNDPDRAKKLEAMGVDHLITETLG